MSKEYLEKEKLLKIIKDNSYPIKHGTNSTELGMTLEGILQAVNESTISEIVVDNIPMTYLEAIEHIENHNKVHKLEERNAVLITRALDIAIQLLKDSIWHNALTDRPSKSGDYLCCTEYGEILEAYYDESVEDEFPFGLWYGQYDSDTLGFIDSYWEAWDAIKWWRELPQLPKELEDDNDERL